MVTKKEGATYGDLAATPDDKIAEIIDGTLYLSARPAGLANRAAAVLFGLLFRHFDGDGGGAGGWHFLYEEELRINGQALVPDIAGWGIERLPIIEDEPAITVVPDWVCEVLSPSTEKYVRTKKLTKYARLGVPFVWLVNPQLRTLEVRQLVQTNWLLLGSFADDDKIRAEPFSAIELDLARLWSAFSTRANEPRARYG